MTMSARVAQGSIASQMADVLLKRSCEGRLNSAV